MIAMFIVACRIIWQGTSILRKDIDWSQIDVGETVHGVYHEKVQVNDDIFIDIVRTLDEEGDKRNKPVMLLVHGFPEGWYSWRHQIEHFRSRYRIVAMSLRGYGQSSRPLDQSKYSLKQLVGDVVGVINQVSDGRKLILVGHDWGGAICWNVARFYPHLLEKLVIACAPHPRCFGKNLSLSQFFKSWYMFFFQVPWIPEFTLSLSNYEFIEKAFESTERENALTPDDIKMYKRDLAIPGALTAAINIYREMARDMTYKSDSARGIQSVKEAKISIPTLVIWAENDAALGLSLLNGLQKYVNDKFLRIEVIKNCSHWCQQDRPEEFNALLDGFL